MSSKNHITVYIVPQTQKANLASLTRKKNKTRREAEEILFLVLTTAAS